jgi:hypothetical protein
MDWDPAEGGVSPILLKNHPSALAESGFVTSAIADGVAARTMRVCARCALLCILSLGMAFTSVGKRRLIWDGRHVNKTCASASSRCSNGRAAPCSSTAIAAAPRIFPARSTPRSITMKWPIPHTLSSVSSGKAFFTASKCSLSASRRPHGYSPRS